jgi:hypothetical protein
MSGLRSGPSEAEGLGAQPAGEATDLIAFAVAYFYFSRI